MTLRFVNYEPVYEPYSTRFEDANFEIDFIF